MIVASIDVSLLDKSRFKRVTRKNGKVAVFAEVVLIEHRSEHADYLIKQSCTKEERAARKEMPILGNGKNFESRSGGAPRRDSAPAAHSPLASGHYDSGEVPF